VTTPDQTPYEARIAARYLEVLDYVSRCADAVRHGDWAALDDLARTLARRADILAEVVRDRRDPDTDTDPRAYVVVGLVAERNVDSEVIDSEAAALLHPYRPGATGKTTSTMLLDPFRARPVPVIDTDPQGHLPLGGRRD
jgi:hypothetical protein